MVTKPNTGRKSSARRAAGAKARAPRPPKPRKGESALDYLIRVSREMPAEIAATLPRDLATNWHHYRHGAPKVDE